MIDAWVASGDTTQHRASIRLLGGRFYPLRLDLFKHKEKGASIRLKWLPPNQAEEVIPERLLAPVKVAPTLVVRTPFPPDDRSTGYVRANRISQAWDEATTYAALEVATRILERLPEYVLLPKDAAEREPRLRQFCATFAQRAFRRPLGPRQREFFIQRLLQGPHPDERDLELAVKETLVLVLKSPRFLYREARLGPSEGGEVFAACDVASWLSFTLWDSLLSAICPVLVLPARPAAPHRANSVWLSCSVPTEWYSPPSGPTRKANWPVSRRAWRRWNRCGVVR